MAPSEKDGESRKGRKGAFRVLQGEGAAESPEPGEASPGFPSCNPLMPGSNLHMGWCQPCDTQASQSRSTESTSASSEPDGGADTEPPQTARADAAPPAGGSAGRQQRGRVVVLERSPTSAVSQAPRADPAVDPARGETPSAQPADRDTPAEHETRAEQSSAGVPAIHRRHSRITPGTTQGRSTETGDATPAPDEADLEKQHAAALAKRRRERPGHRPWRRTRAGHLGQQRSQRRRRAIAAVALLGSTLTLILGLQLSGPTGRRTQHTGTLAQAQLDPVQPWLFALAENPLHTGNALGLVRSTVHPRPPGDARHRRSRPHASRSINHPAVTAVAAAGATSSASVSTATDSSAPVQPDVSYSPPPQPVAAVAGGSSDSAPSSPSSQPSSPNQPVASYSPPAQTSAPAPNPANRPASSSASSESSGSSGSSGKFATFGPGY